MSNIAVIIVTHNSLPMLDLCLASLLDQTVKPHTIILVDSGSDDSGELQKYENEDGVTVHRADNIGFSQANNRGYATLAQSSDFVLFLNPDCFPMPEAIARCSDFLKNNPKVGCVSGRLLGFDTATGQPSGKIDSTGVFRKWYGCWYDRDQGKTDIGQHGIQEDVPAGCGAFLFCRKTMLDQVALQQGVIFDPDFFLYKEDIELCLRIRKAGWRIVYLPEVIAFHCRGWQQKRSIIPHQQRLTAARSELVLYRKHPSPYMIWALGKYLLVRWFRV